MKKIFENWRKRGLCEQSEYVDPATGDPGTGKPQIKLPAPVFGQKYVKVPAAASMTEEERAQHIAEFEDMFEKYKHEFIQTLVLDRKEKLIKNLKTFIGAAKARVLPEDWAIREIANWLKNTKVKFMVGPRSGKDPDYGGPAYYTKTTNTVYFEEFDTFWVNYRLRGKAPHFWPGGGVDIKKGETAAQSMYFKSSTYHEFGHALDAGIVKTIKKAKVMSTEDFFDISTLGKITAPGLYPPIPDRPLFVGGKRKMVGIGRKKDVTPSKEMQEEIRRVTGHYYSSTQWKKVRQITNKRLHWTGRAGSLHEESIIEFFASLKELVLILKRKILPIDIEVHCYSRHMRVSMEKGVATLRPDGGRLRRIKKEWEDTVLKLNKRERKYVWHQIIGVGESPANETLRMLDCNKHPQFVAKVLNELI